MAAPGYLHHGRYGICQSFIYQWSIWNLGICAYVMHIFSGLIDNVSVFNVSYCDWTAGGSMWIAGCQHNVWQLMPDLLFKAITTLSMGALCEDGQSFLHALWAFSQEELRHSTHGMHVWTTWTTMPSHVTHQPHKAGKTWSIRCVYSCNPTGHHPSSEVTFCGTPRRYVLL